MMYRRKRASLWPFVIIIGIVSGIIFLLIDQRPSLVLSSPTPTPSDAQAAALEIPTQAPPSTAVPTPQSAVQQARLLIPAAAVSSPIIPVYLDGESWDVSRLGVHVGHLQGTAWFNQTGNVVLSGHVELSDGRRGVFASLSDLLVGDTIIVEYEGTQRRYAVTEISSVEPDDLTPLYPASSERLTLITCDSYDFFSDSYLQRTIVVAERQS